MSLLPRSEAFAVVYNVGVKGAYNRHPDAVITSPLPFILRYVFAHTRADVCYSACVCVYYNDTS